MKQQLRTDCTIETDNYIVTYDCTDESFDHEFGTEKSYGYDITDIQVYMPIFNNYIEYSVLSGCLKAIKFIAEKAVEKDIADKGYFEDVEPNDYDQEI